MAAPIEQPNLRDKQKALTRDALIRAASEICAEEGFSSVSIDKIAQRAGSSRATFYLHFPSKIALAKAVNEQLDMVALPLYDSLRQHAEEALPLKSWMSEVIRYWTDNRDAIATAQQATMSEPAMMEVMQDRTNRYASVVESLLAKSISGAEVRRTTAVAMILQLERVNYLWQVAGWEFSAAAVHDMFTDSWERVLEPWASQRNAN